MLSLVLASLALVVITGTPPISNSASGPVTIAASQATDSAGQPLDAHDGQVFKDPDGSYRLIGTRYTCQPYGAFQYANFPVDTPWCGARMYISSDLQSWTLVGDLLNYTLPWLQAACSSNGGGCFEPRVAQRPDGQWVMWINTGNSALYPGGYLVFQAPGSGGPWTQVPSPIPPDYVAGVTHYGAEQIYEDPATGVGWLSYTWVDAATNAHVIRVAKLDASFERFAAVGNVKFTDPTLAYHVVGNGSALVEAPALLRVGDTWYVFYSDPACPYCGNAGTTYATSPGGDDGPTVWTVRGTVLATSCGGQFDDVSVLNGQPYIHTDQWQQPATPTGQRYPFLQNQTVAKMYFAPIIGLTPDGLIPSQSCVTSFVP